MTCSSLADSQRSRSWRWFRNDGWFGYRNALYFKLTSVQKLTSARAIFRCDSPMVTTWFEIIDDVFVPLDQTINKHILKLLVSGNLKPVGCDPGKFVPRNLCCCPI